MAFRGIGTDDIGKDALKKIHVVHVKQAAPAKVELNNDRLYIQGEYDKGISGALSDNEIAAYLDKTLRIRYNRVVHILRNKQIPERLKEAREVFGGGSFEWDPDYSSLTTEGAAEFFDNICCLRTLMAFRDVVSQFGTQGQTTLRDKVKKARFVNISKPDERKLSFSSSDGVLEVRQQIDRSGTSTSDYYSNLEIFELLANNLGLRVSQKLSDLRDKQIPERTKEVQEILGVPVQYDVEYPSFTSDQELVYVDNVTCHRVNMALRCLDSKTKEALQKSLKKIHLKNVGNTAAKKLEVSGDTLTMHCNYASGLSGAFSDNEILAALKKSV